MSIVAGQAGRLEVARRNFGDVRFGSTLLAFAIVCLGVLVLRIRRPNLLRAFQTPAVYIVAPFGALSALFLMCEMPLDTWLRLGAWLAIGFVIYVFYGIRHSCVQKSALAPPRM